MTTVISSSGLTAAIDLIFLRDGNGAFDLEGRFRDSINRFRTLLEDGPDPEVITLSTTRIELRYDAAASAGLPAVDYRLILTGSGIGPVSTLEGLQDAIGEGLATGRLNAITLMANGAPHLTFGLAPGGYTLASGVDTFTLSGAMPTSFAEMTELADLLGRFDLNDIALLSLPDRAAYFAGLAQFGVTGFSVQSAGATFLSLAITASSATLILDGLTFTLTGTLPDDFGALAATLFDVFTLFEQTGDELDLSLLAGFGVDALVVTSAAGAELLRLTGPISTLEIASHTLTGTSGDDAVDVDDIPFGDADTLQISLLGGNDFATLSTYDLFERARYQGVPLSDMPVISIDGGTGLNLLTVRNQAFGATAEIDLNRGVIVGHDSRGNAMADLYSVAISGFQRVALEGGGFTVYGSAANEMVMLSSGFTDQLVVFNAGAGNDTLDLTGIVQSERSSFFQGVSARDLADYRFETDVTDGSIRMVYTGSANFPDAVLADVEFLRVRQDASPQNVQFVTLSSLVTTRHVLDESGTPFGGSYLNDTVVGSAVGDDIAGHNGNDVLAGNGGNDTLNGGDGGDTLNGGAGDDFIFGGATPSDMRDVVFGGDGHDSVNGGAGNDDLNGGAGNDTVIGGLGADTITGNEGDDLLGGSGGADVLSGNAGNDTLNGGFGYDRVNGGAGADSFFHAGVADHGSDWIQDYSAGLGDVLTVGLAGATRAQFQVNITTTTGAGSAGVAEAFVVYRPTGQILWALVDGGDDTQININIGGQVFDLLA